MNKFSRIYSTVILNELKDIDAASLVRKRLIHNVFTVIQFCSLKINVKPYRITPITVHKNSLRLAMHYWTNFHVPLLLKNRTKLHKVWLLYGIYYFKKITFGIQRTTLIMLKKWFCLSGINPLVSNARKSARSAKILILK